MPNINRLQDLVKNFEKTLDDNNFSRNERNALKQHIADKNLNEDEKRYLENQLFDLAKSKINSANYLQILYWVEEAGKALNQTSPQITEEAFFSPGDDCVNAINGCIEKANISIDICVFTITDNRISRTLKDAHDRGVKIRIITDNDKSLDRGSDVNDLYKNGIETKIDYTDDHMHHKFAIFDNRALITGSYNWTRSAGNSNYENILITNNPGMIDKFKNEFEDLWLNMMDLGYNPHG
mgnify:FL=1